jgi:hypothetical protein
MILYLSVENFACEVENLVKWKTLNRGIQFQFKQYEAVSADGNTDGHVSQEFPEFCIVSDNIVFNLLIILFESI